MTSQLSFEDTIARIKANSSVLGIVVLDSNGKLIRTEFNSTRTEEVAKLVSLIAFQTKAALKAYDPEDDAVIIRVRTKRQEVLVVPEGTKYILGVVMDVVLDGNKDETEQQQQQQQQQQPNTTTATTTLNPASAPQAVSNTSFTGAAALDSSISDTLRKLSSLGSFSRD